MTPLRFYEHLACAIGTIWLLLLSWSLLFQEPINVGGFGLFGLAIMALIYAYIRKSKEESQSDESLELICEITRLRNLLENQDE